MKVKDMADSLGLKIAAGESGLTRDIESVYCCDLLSFAMGKAPDSCAWVTVMSNINIIAVASLADMACIVLAEGVKPDSAAAEKADEQGIAILESALPAFECAMEIHKYICLGK